MEERTATTNRGFYLITLLFGLPSIFGAFLYYLGRRYTESYFEVLGVPVPALRFGFADYLFVAVKNWLFLIAVALTLLVYILWLVIRQQREMKIVVSGSLPRKEGSRKALLGSIVGILRIVRRTFSYRKGDPQFFMLWMFIYVVFVMLFTLFQIILQQAERNFTVEGFTYLLMILFLLPFSWLIVTDKPTMQYILGRRLLTGIVLGAIIFTVIITAQLLPHALGRFVGVIHSSPNHIERLFPTVQLTAEQPIGPPDLQWFATGERSVSTKGRILLILLTEDGLFLRQMGGESNTFFVPLQYTLGLTINIPGQPFFKPSRTSENITQ